MKRVIVYEVSQAHHDVVGSHVEMYDRDPIGETKVTAFSLPAGGPPLFAFGDKIRRFSLPVQEVRYEGKTEYLAIGPKLHRMLDIALRGEYEDREVELKSIFQRRAILAEQENNRLLQCFERFHATNRFKRAWLAFFGRLP